jgi:hypothetical protein
VPVFLSAHFHIDEVPLFVPPVCHREFIFFACNKAIDLKE